MFVKKVEFYFNVTEKKKSTVKKSVDSNTKFKKIILK